MPWVNRDSYRPGSRHYVEGVERRWGEVKERTFEREPDIVYYYRYFTDVATSPTLCADPRPGWEPRPWQESGYVMERSDGKRGHKHGGLSSKETINLMQRNVCSRCRKRYIASRPELQAAVDALKKAQVMS